MKTITTTALLLAFIAGCATAPPATTVEPPTEPATDRALTLQEEATILKLEDRRELDRNLNQGWSHHPSATHRARLAMALGRIGEATFDDRNGNGVRDSGETMAGVPTLIAMSNDPDVRVRRNVAFALGEIGDPAGVAVLQKLSHDPEHADVASEAVEALSKLAAQVPLDQYLPLTRATMPEGVRARAIRFLFRFDGDAPLATAAALLDDPSVPARREAAYSLSRRALASARDKLETVASDPDVLTRSYAIRTLGTIGDVHSLPVLFAALQDPHPWVRTNAGRALNQMAAKDPSWLGGENMMDHLASAVTLAVDPDPGTRAIGVELLGQFASLTKEARERLLTIAVEGRRWYQEIATAAIARHFAESEPGVLEPLLQTDSRGVKIGVLQATASMVTAGPKLRARYTDDPDASVRAAVVSAIPDDRVDAELSTIEHLLDDPDPIVRASAIERFAKGSSHPVAETVSRLRSAEEKSRSDSLDDARLAAITALADIDFPERETLLRGWVQDSDPVVRRNAAEALVALGKPRVQFTPLPVHRADDEYLRIAEWAQASHSATIHTVRGDIQLVLLPQPAPITAWNFAQLAGRGYFDATSFMRVVPNFVIQGGDPRNDMSGGPGYAIRDEINLQKYTRGAVGMALSGPDTGGSQFFITHSPQHHLDGGYTIFGRVTGGMTAVVDQMEKGDGVTGIEIDAKAPAAESAIRSVEATPLPLQVGPVNEEHCLETIPEYRARMDAYQPDPGVLQLMAASLHPEDRIEVVLGTWCTDSQDEVPKFFAILRDLQQSFGVTVPVSYLAVDRSKQEPSAELEGIHLENVPTFIVRRGDEELGRIVEKPTGLLEDDLLAILAR